MQLTFGQVKPTYEERLGIANLTTFYQQRLRGDHIKTFRTRKYNFGDLITIFSLNTDTVVFGEMNLN